MKMTQVTEPEFIKELLVLAHEEYKLDLIIQLDLEVDKLIEYLIEQAWVILFYPEKCDKIYAMLILEWTGEREASLHFCMFNRGNILRGWKMFVETYSSNFDLLETYIPMDRPDVLRIAKAIGFEFKNNERIYHGQQRFST